MNKIAKISLLAVGAAMVTQALQAQSDSGSINNNDLVLGFTSQAPGVTEDYILDLGQIPTQNNTQLGGISLSAFNTVFGSALADGEVNVGIIGGAASGTKDVITSLLDNGTGTPTSAGSTPPTQPSSSFLASAAGDAVSVSLGAVAQSSGTSFSSIVAQNPTTAGSAQNSFTGYLGSSANPLETIGSSETITLDLWKSSAVGAHGTSAFTYIGDISLDLTGSTLSAIYDPVAVPEPSTYGLLAGAGLLAVAFRRQFASKNA